MLRGVLRSRPIISQSFGLFQSVGSERLVGIGPRPHPFLSANRRDDEDAPGSLCARQAAERHAFLRGLWRGQVGPNTALPTRRGLYPPSVAGRPDTRPPLGAAAGFVRAFNGPTEGTDRRTDAEEMAAARRPVIFSLLMNALGLCSKVALWVYSPSSSVLAEAYHSAGDLVVQAMLIPGIQKAAEGPTAQYNYGQGRANFLFSLFSAVSFFLIGGAASGIQGVYSLWYPPEELEVAVSSVVLFLMMGVEATTMGYAMRELGRGAVLAGTPWQQAGQYVTYIRENMHKHPSTNAIFWQEGASVAGVGIAVAALQLTHWTGLVIFDSLGSFAVGGVMGVVALHLIRENYSMIMGRAMEPAALAAIVARLRTDAVVAQVLDVKSEMMGPERYRFKAEIEFHGGQVVRKLFEVEDRAALLVSLRQAAAAPGGGGDHQLGALLDKYGERVVEQVGMEVDRIERDIVEMNPSIKHIDLETHSHGYYRRAEVLGGPPGTSTGIGGERFFPPAGVKTAD